MLQNSQVWLVVTCSADFESRLMLSSGLEILAPLFNKSIISARPVLCWYIFDARGKSLLAITLEMKPQQQQVHQFLGLEEPVLIFAKYLIALILSTYLCIIKSKLAFYIEVLLLYLLFEQLFYPLFRRYLLRYLC